MPLDQLNIRTEEIDEILGKTPNKIIRWGVTVIFLIIVVLLTGSWFFKYPDKIVSSIEISTLNPPAVVVAKATGKIASLYVHNNERVYEGQLLADQSLLCYPHTFIKNRYHSFKSTCRFTNSSFHRQEYIESFETISNA